MVVVRALGNTFGRMIKMLQDELWDLAEINVMMKDTEVKSIREIRDVFKALYYMQLVSGNVDALGKKARALSVLRQEALVMADEAVAFFVSSSVVDGEVDGDDIIIESL